MREVGSDFYLSKLFPGIHSREDKESWTHKVHTDFASEYMTLVVSKK